MFFAIHQHESAILNGPSCLPPHPIPLGCPRAPALGALLQASNLHWLSLLHIAIEIQCYSLIPSHPHLLPHCPKVCLYVPVSFAVLLHALL